MRRSLRRTRWLGFAVAIVAPTVVFVVGMLLPLSVRDPSVFALSSGAILAATYFGGWASGAAVSAAAFVGFVLLQAPPSQALGAVHVASAISLILAGVLSTLFVVIPRLWRESADALPLKRRGRAVPARSDDRFSVVFDSAPVAIMVVRVGDGQLMDLNAAFTELWGYTRTEAIGRTSKELKLWIEPAQLIQKLRENRYSDAQELQIRHQSGEVRDVLASVTLIRIDGSAHLLITAADVTERNRTRLLEHIAHHDMLTQLPNRLMLWTRLKEVRERTLANRTTSAVLFIDLDRFKHVNDSFGHQAGDELLRLVAARLQGRLRATDLLARLGGDEFVIVLENLHDVQEAEAIANDLVRHIAMPFVLSGRQEVHIGASIGISYLTTEENDVESIIQQADAALYSAKSTGRSTARVFRALGKFGQMA